VTGLPDNTLQVRLGAAADAAALAALCDVVHTLHLERRPDFFRPAPLEELRVWFEKMLGDPKASVWLAEAAGAAVGYLLVVRHERAQTPFTHARRWCDFDQISVLPGQRRRGVARALIEAGLAEARAGGFEQVDVLCWAFNDVAQSVFRQLGFTPKVVRLEWPGRG
jgi:ribosomal protein S18 acetylase RimI-like enzyme